MVTPTQTSGPPALSLKVPKLQSRLSRTHKSAREEQEAGEGYRATWA